MSTISTTANNPSSRVSILDLSTELIQSIVLECATECLPHLCVTAKVFSEAASSELFLRADEFDVFWDYDSESARLLRDNWTGSRRFACATIASWDEWLAWSNWSNTVTQSSKSSNPFRRMRKLGLGTLNDTTASTAISVLSQLTPELVVFGLGDVQSLHFEIGSLDIAVAQFSKLKKLFFKHPLIRIDGSIFSYFASCMPNLESLEIWLSVGGQFESEHLECLGALPKLKTLEIFGKIVAQPTSFTGSFCNLETLLLACDRTSPLDRQHRPPRSLFSGPHPLMRHLEYNFLGLPGFEDKFMTSLSKGHFPELRSFSLIHSKTWDKAGLDMLTAAGFEWFTTPPGPVRPGERLTASR